MADASADIFRVFKLSTDFMFIYAHPPISFLFQLVLGWFALHFRQSMLQDPDIARSERRHKPSFCHCEVALAGLGMVLWVVYYQMKAKSVVNKRLGKSENGTLNLIF